MSSVPAARISHEDGRVMISHDQMGHGPHGSEMQGLLMLPYTLSCTAQRQNTTQACEVQVVQS